ncbi:hypothetical protein ZYGNAAKF_CDS0119 [Enterococcus phage VRE9_2]
MLPPNYVQPMKVMGDCSMPNLRGCSALNL